MKSSTVQERPPNCLYCYTTTAGKQLESTLLERFRYWDLALHPEELRQRSARKAAGLLIAGPSLGHVENLLDIPQCARSEKDEVIQVAATMLVESVSDISTWKGDYSATQEKGRRAGAIIEHYSMHIIPVIDGDVQGGVLLALRSLKLAEDKILEQK